MNQLEVEFLGLAYTFVTVFKTFHAKPAQKRYNYLSKFVREVPSNNHQSCNLIGHYYCLEISRRNSTSFTRLFLTRRCAQAEHKTRIHPTSSNLQSQSSMEIFHPLYYKAAKPQVECVLKYQTYLVSITSP